MTAGKIDTAGRLLRRGTEMVRTGLHLSGMLVRAQVRDEWLGQYFPPKPTVIQFPVNDICNSRCVMCNIWKRKRDKELTPDELRTILADPLFEQVRYVGISGGEPTLRRDLPELARAMVETLPNLRGTGIITNALRAEMVIERTLATAEVVRQAGKSFSVIVSLDGVGEDHDRNRGVPGNFASAVQVIEALQANGLEPGIGCTLTAVNAYGADDLLLWCDEHGIKNREFRLGVEIKRVYNDGFAQRMPLDEEQRFHLTMFFDKLAHDPTVDRERRRFYRSLVGQMAHGAPRRSGCSWRTRGVTLDARGNVSYCSVQSPILGSALERSAEQIFHQGLPERRRILREHCDTCQHDLSGDPPASELLRDLARQVEASASTYWRALESATGLDRGRYRAPAAIQPATRPRPSEWRHVVVTGWYGTETAGDKAILGGFLQFLRQRAPDCRVTLTTLDPKVSQQTNRELPELEGVRLVPVQRGADPGLIESADAVVIAGGPLEEIGETRYIWRMFAEANRQEKARVIFGCGVGPLHSRRLREMVAAICRMATAGFFRDEESLELARSLGAETIRHFACDPALAYLRRWRREHLPTRQIGEPRRIAGLLRANTDEYVVDMPPEALAAFNRQTAEQLAAILERVCVARGAKAVLLPMHALWVGGDDRVFNRQVAPAFQDPSLAEVERRYLPFDDLLGALAPAEAALAMRYHGHLFCLALGIPFLSVDYTGKGGKVHSLVRRLGYEEWSEEWRGIDVARAAARLQRLADEAEHWSAHLLARTDALVDDLERVYGEAFGEVAEAALVGR